MSDASRQSLRYLESPRLMLVAGSAEVVQADLAGREALAGALDAAVPDNWPPEHFESTAMRASFERLREGIRGGWASWYLVVHEDRRELIGMCGFKGRPDAAGSVEIAYAVLPQYRGRGFATEAVSRLVGWAFSHREVRRVTAETLPHLRESIRVLEKSGFRFEGRASEYGMVRFAVFPPDRR